MFLRVCYDRRCGDVYNLWPRKKRQRVIGITKSVEASYGYVVAGKTSGAFFPVRNQIA